MKDIKEIIFSLVVLLASASLLAQDFVPSDPPYLKQFLQKSGDSLAPAVLDQVDAYSKDYRELTSESDRLSRTLFANEKGFQAKKDRFKETTLKSFVQSLGRTHLATLLSILSSQPPGLYRNKYSLSDIDAALKTEVELQTLTFQGEENPEQALKVYRMKGLLSDLGYLQEEISKDLQERPGKSAPNANMVKQ